MVRDDTITKIEYHSYNPYSNSSLNKNDEIRIPVQNMSSFVLPHESYLYVEGKLPELTPETLNSINFTKNFVPFLFSEVRFEMNGISVDQIKNPGIVSTLKYYLSLSAAELASNQHLWYKEDLIMNKIQTFSYIIPMSKLMGFFQDYKEIVIFSKLELVLLRSRTDNNCVFQIPTQNAAASTLNILLTKVQWCIPHVEVNDVHKLKLLKILQSGRRISMPFRSWQYHENPQLPQSSRITWQDKTASEMEKPLFVIIGFQTARQDISTTNGTIFDHCKLQNAKLFLNSQQFNMLLLTICFVIL